MDATLSDNFADHLESATTTAKPEPQPRPDAKKVAKRPTAKSDTKPSRLNKDSSEGTTAPDDLCSDAGTETPQTEPTDNAPTEAESTDAESKPRPEATDTETDDVTQSTPQPQDLVGQQAIAAATNPTATPAQPTDQKPEAKVPIKAADPVRQTTAVTAAAPAPEAQSAPSPEAASATITDSTKPATPADKAEIADIPVPSDESPTPETATTTAVRRASQQQTPDDSQQQKQEQGDKQPTTDPNLSLAIPDQPKDPAAPAAPEAAQKPAASAKPTVSALGVETDIAPAGKSDRPTKPISANAATSTIDATAAAIAAVPTDTTDFSADGATASPRAKSTLDLDPIVGVPALQSSDSTAQSAPGAKPTQPLPPAPPEAQFADANHDKIVTGVRTQMAAGGNGSMQIRLDPPELGALKVSIEMANGQMTATFQTSNEQATQLLSHSLNQLKHVLESQGVTVDRLQVQQAPKSEQAPTGQDDPKQQQQNWSDDHAARQEQQRKEMLKRMWRKVSGAGDPIDFLA